MRTAWALFLTLLAGVAAAGIERPYATAVSFQELWRAPGEIVLPIAAEPSRTELALPALGADGRTLCLRFAARLTTPRPAGWNNYLGVIFNGKPLGARLADGPVRLLNRRPAAETTHPNYRRISLVEPRGGLPCLQIFFGPEDSLAPELLTDREEGYWYLLEIGDLARADGANTIELVNTALAQYWPGGPGEGVTLSIAGLAVGTIPLEEAAALRGAQLERREPLPGPALEVAGATVTVSPGGGLQVERGGDRWAIESAYSYVRDGGMGWNHLSCLPVASGQPGWAPAVSTEGGLQVTAAAADYRLDRRLRVEGARVTVTDSLTNTTDQLLGVAVRHDAIVQGYPRQILLNGLETAGSGPGRLPENPTLFVAGTAGGLGVLAEDDAMRLQMSTAAGTNTATMENRRLGLSPGETYTLQWAIYPCDDYWAFVNTVRRDWDVNFTVDGPWDFFDVRRLAGAEGRAAVKALLARKRLKWFALVPWFEYYNGWGLSREQYREQMAAAMAFLREVVPEGKFMACVETNLVPVPLTLFGDTIPADWPIGRDRGGKYGQPAPPAMTRVIDGTPWRDSCLRDRDGNLLLDCWYVQHYKDPPALNLMVYPTLDNHRHAHALEQFGWLLDEVGFDGLYIDQFSMSGATHRYTYDRWDGRTVDLDPNGRVIARVGDVTLLSAAARRAWVEFALARGKRVVANGQPCVSALRRLPAWRFMESQGYDPLTPDGPPYHSVFAQGQLAAPLALGHGAGWLKEASARAFVRTVVAHLRFGLLYYYYLFEFPPDGPLGGEYGPVNHMFPFTPIELHEGWILGQERLITCRSGEYPWPHEREPKVYQFDSAGRERPADAQILARDGRTMVRLTMNDWNEIAVVE